MAVPYLVHEWPHAVRDAERAAAATCEGLVVTGRTNQRDTTVGNIAIAHGMQP